MSNAIGEFEFLSLHGQPLRPDDEQVLVCSRPGVDGVVLWLKGQRGRPFRLRAAVDCISFSQAVWLYGELLKLKDHDPVSLVWGGITMPYQVSVIEVEPVERGSLLASVGGINPPSYGWAEYDFTLVSRFPQE